MEKRCILNKSWPFPQPGEILVIALLSPDKRESFIPDVSRARIKLTKATYQTRGRQAVVLMRLDVDGPPHRNQDGAEVPCPHLHVYREEYGDKWASPAAADRYPNAQDLFSTFEAFLRHCNITEPPEIQRVLF